MPWDGRAARLRRLRDLLHDRRLDGVLVSQPADVRWLTGFSGSAGLLIVEPGSATLITDFRYETQSADEVDDDISVVIATDDMLEALPDCLEGSAAVRIGFDEHDLKVADRTALDEACGGVAWEPTGSIARGLRAEKDADEIDAIRQAAAVAEAALEQTLATVEEGATERDIAAELVYHLMRNGSESLPFEPIVAAGERSALPHARPGDRALREGDLLLLDFGAVVKGYCSDLTRSFTLGTAAPWQREIHGIVDEAVSSAVEAVAAGVPARDVDRAARTIIEGAGYGASFGHGTGHGVGLEVHELPRINARSRDLLAEGNVVTIEPGIYLPGRGGVRLEELIHAANGAPRLLTESSRALREL